MKTLTRTLALAAGAFALMLAAPTAPAAMLHDELFDGELPTVDGDVPLLEASFGSNQVRILTGPGDVDPIDVFDLLLPAGGVLQSIVVEGYRPGPDNFSSSFGTVGPDGVISEGIRLMTAIIGEDVISEFEGLFGGTGPFRLGFGEDFGPAEVQLDFIVTPLPAAGVFLASALVALGGLRAGGRRPG